MKETIEIFRNFVRKITFVPRRIYSNLNFINTILGINLNEYIANRQRNHPNSFVCYGNKCFSQTDEDGLTIEIIRRIGINSGVFAEYGVGDGCENNTLILLALGWSGFWVGGQDLAFDATQSNKLYFDKLWVTRNNIYSSFSRGMEKLSVLQVDLISLDLDGNDFYLCEELLNRGVSPKVFIVEYNAKFIPPVEFIIDYNQGHIWNSDDYFSASLQSYVNLFRKHGYVLICCNAATGANAFFVKEEFANLFPETPKDIEKIYVPPSYYRYESYGHPVSLETIKKIICS